MQRGKVGASHLGTPPREPNEICCFLGMTRNPSLDLPTASQDGERRGEGMRKRHFSGQG